MARTIYPLKLDAVEKAAIRARAEARGLTMASYLRGLALGTLQPDPPLGTPAGLKGGSHEIGEPGGSGGMAGLMERRRREIEERAVS